jgi:polyferredoxin
MKKNNNYNILRNTILLTILGIIILNSYLHATNSSRLFPSIHALCPYGALESLYYLLFSGDMLKRIFTGTFILLGLTIIIAILFRRSFCGQLCPFGALQELINKVGNKIFKKKLIIPEKIDKKLRYLKYFILALTLYMAIITTGLWYSSYDPYSALGHIFKIEELLIWPSIIGLILLIFIIIVSLIYDRVFCKYICPMGAFLSLISRISPMKITRNNKTCINCKICDKVCPMNIEVSKEKEITNTECINCNVCVNNCPKEDTLEINLKNKKITPTKLTVIVLLIFFGTIFIADLLGIYTVKQGQVGKGTLIKNNQSNVSEIRGSMTLKDLTNGLNMTKEELYNKLEIDLTVSENTLLKDLQNNYPSLTPGLIKQKIDPEYNEEH